MLPSETTLSSSDAVEAVSQGTPDNLCEGINGILTGGDPGWVRVNGNSNPFSQLFIEVSGQVFPDLDHKSNPFVTHTDAPFNHYSHDINVFVTLDAPYRNRLASGNFTLGNPNELGELEIEWERGGIPLFAYPAPHDRITVWGPWIWDCGHGELENVHYDPTPPFDPNDPFNFGVISDAKYRTEIHPPVGWVVFRNSANQSDRNKDPRAEKRTQSPWKWYEADDFQGTGETVASTGGTLDTPIQTTVADAFFSSFGGNIPEALNGCDDTTVVSADTADATCFFSISAGSFEWAQPLLMRDYSFFIPAPARPTPDATMVFVVEDRCAEVPSNPGNPPGDDVEDVGEASDTADNIGAPACNTIPDQIVVTQDANGQPGIQVTVKAASGGATYPANDYIAYAKRFKVAWDYVLAEGQRPHTYKVDFQTLQVIDDTDNLIGPDGEWVVSLRANEKWIHPVRGHGDSNDPFWEDGALAEGTNYSIGESLTVTPGVGEPLRVWMHGWDDDHAPLTGNNNFNDVLPLVNKYHSGAELPAPGASMQFTVAAQGGNAGDEDEFGGAYNLVYTITDVTDPQPPSCCIDFGSPQFGPGPETNGLLRVNGTDAHETPITVAHASIDGLEWRFWTVGDPVPAAWNFDSDAGDTLRIDLPSASAASGTYNVEWATVDTTSGRRIVSPRERFKVELDNTPPVLAVPADFSVIATETGGAHVTYTVTATDNFPGPTTIACVPPSGALFPNGKNAPQVTTVTCTATDAVENQSVASFHVTVASPFGYLDDFVVLGLEWAKLGSSVVVQSGNVGVFDQSVGVPTSPGFEVVTGSSTILSGGPQIASHSEKLGNGSVSGDVFFVTPISAGNGALFTPKLGYVPLFLGLPLVPANSPGGADKTLSGKQSLPAGNYGMLTVQSNAKINLSGGTYTFSSIEVKSNAQLSFLAPSTVVVSGRILLGSGTSFGGIVTSGGGVAASNVLVYANGLDGPPNKPANAFAIGSHAFVRIDAYAPNGTLSLDSYATGTGAFLGRRVDVADNVALSLDSSFLLP